MGEVDQRMEYFSVVPMGTASSKGEVQVRTALRAVDDIAATRSVMAGGVIVGEAEESATQTRPRGAKAGTAKRFMRPSIIRRREYTVSRRACRENARRGILLG